MRFGHAHSEPRDIARAKRLCAIEHTRVFRDNVQRTLVDDLGEHVAMLLKLLEANISECTDLRQDSSEPADSLFTIRATAIVLAGGQFVFDHGIADNQFYGIGNQERFKT